MNPTEIVAMGPGPALDNLVHAHIFGRKGKAPNYSTDDAAALAILDKVPLFVASVEPGKPDYNPAKPFVAGRLQHEPSVKGDVTILRVTAATKSIALCKAALLTLAKVGAAPSMQDRIGAQVQSRRAGSKKERVPMPIRKHMAQPAAGITKNINRIPLPPRKPFITGAAQIDAKK